MTLKVLTAVTASTAVLVLSTVSCGQTTHASATDHGPDARETRATAAATAAMAAPIPATGSTVRGWLSWRGPQQNGTSLEKGLPEDVTPGKAEGSWTYELAGRGTPVVAGTRLYTMGYEGEGKELEELLLCVDTRTGQRVWEHRFTEFLTDIIYNRFAISSPTVDPQTGNVYCMTSAGLLSGLTADGQMLWQHSMMDEYGRLTFPNGRTGAPVIDGDLVIIHTPTSAWGAHSPARDRFYAFDKVTGESIWSSTPGGAPNDASFSFPVITWENGQRVLYAGLAGGNMVCVNVLTGQPIWQFQMATGGVNCSPVLYKNSVIAAHGKENIDSSVIGRMVAIRRGRGPSADGPTELSRADELWRNDLVSFSSSPVLVGDRLYLTVHTGELHCVDADSGKKLWHEKLGSDQIHASPAWGDGKLYVPMNDGTFWVLRPTDDGAGVVQKVQLEGNCLGAPAIADGRIYVHTNRRLYCFAGGRGGLLDQPAAEAAPPLGEAAQLQIVPGDSLAAQGDTLQYRVRSLDSHGQIVDPDVKGIQWGGVPAGGTTMNAEGVLTIPIDGRPAATILTATLEDLSASARLRIVRRPPYTDDFDDTELGPSPTEDGVRVAPARPYWATAAKKWEIRDHEGGVVLAKTLDIPLFMRTVSPIGAPDMSNYTMQADVSSDGNRRTMSAVGVINQRYQIILKGNHQELEISSNVELLKESVPFKWKPKVWYRLESRVDMQPDGSAIVRAKAWPRDESEPDAWTLEVTHPHGHAHGSPGIYGFSPQSRFRVYIDNISVTPNE